MILHYEHNCVNSIDLIDEDDNVVGLIHGPNEGESDITERELTLAHRICEGYNR